MTMTKIAPSVLVVDDDPECLEFARGVLAPYFRVRTAVSIDQCRAEIKVKKPDVLILDVMLSHLCDGLDFTRELKETANTRGIPVIMLTCVNMTYDYRDQVRADYFPHDRWLDKPVKPEVLLKTVKKLLEPGQEE